MDRMWIIERLLFILLQTQIAFTQKEDIILRWKESMHILQIILVRIQISYWYRLLILSKWTWLSLCILFIILIIKLIFVHFWDESGRGLLWYTLDVVGFGVRTWLTFLEQVPNLNYCLSLLYQTCMDCALGHN